MFKKETSKPDMEYFAIYDSKVGIYRDPILALNEWSIIRDYERVCRSEQGKENELVTNAEDFQLFRIGSYTRATALLTACTPTHVVSFHEVKAKLLADQSRNALTIAQ